MRKNCLRCVLLQFKEKFYHHGSMAIPVILAVHLVLLILPINSSFSGSILSIISGSELLTSSQSNFCAIFLIRSFILWFFRRDLLQLLRPLNLSKSKVGSASCIVSINTQFRSSSSIVVLIRVLAVIIYYH